jgi:hypothetical protein
VDSETIGRNRTPCPRWAESSASSAFEKLMSSRGEKIGARDGVYITIF